VSGCRHQPRPETCCTLAGRPADLLRGQDYPITALCMFCGRPIRSERLVITSGPPWTAADPV
jgi:hypothetical protein